MADKNAPRHTARFGARYGVSVKKRFETIEVKQRVKHVCPKCGFQKVQRVSTGIFHCNKCNAKYAGGAFYPQTLSGGIIAKMVAQRTFNPNLIETMVEQEELPAKEQLEMSDEDKIAQLTQTDSAPKKKTKKAKKEESVEETEMKDDIQEVADEDDKE